MTVFIFLFSLFILVAGCLFSCGQGQTDQQKNASGQNEFSLSETEVQQKRDSLYPLAKEIHQQEVRNYRYDMPRISASEKNAIQPVIRKWLDYYDLDLSLAIFEGIYDYDIQDDPYKDSIYYREFTEKEDKSNLPMVDYSPDKIRYVDLGLFIDKDEEGGFVVWGDDCQDIYLIDRRLKVNNIICHFGSVARAEAVLWKDNNTFYLLGFRDILTLDIEVESELFEMSGIEFFVYEYDLAAKTKKEYQIFADGDQRKPLGYITNVIAPKR